MLFAERFPVEEANPEWLRSKDPISLFLAPLLFAFWRRFSVLSFFIEGSVNEEFDLDGDGTITEQDVFLFSLWWRREVLR